MAYKTSQYEDVKALFMISVFFAASAVLARPLEKFFSDDDSISWVMFYASLVTGVVCIATLLATALRSLRKRSL